LLIRYANGRRKLLPRTPTQWLKDCLSIGYRTHIKRNVCPDFGLVWDVHDGHKHAVLGRVNRQVTKSTQTGLGKMTFDEARFDETVFDGEQIVVHLDDGSKRALTAIMLNVMEMWEKALQQMNL